MVKTLLLCFIHGYKGDEETFFQFPEVCFTLQLKYLSTLIITQQDLKNIVSKESPDINVETRVYPKYETRGDLAACVETFREW
jgi:hypothetical protein